VVGLYTIATLAPYKGTGQDVALLIPVAVISAVGLAGLRRFRVPVCAAVLAFAVLQAVALSLPEPTLAAYVGSFRWAGSYQTFPAADDWQFRRALGALGVRPLTLRVVSDDMYVNGITVNYFVRSAGLPFTVIERYGASANQVRDADVVMAKSDWSLAVSHATTRGRSLKGVPTASLGVMYTRGNCDVERPDEPLTNTLSRRDVELRVVTDDYIRQDHPYVRDYPLPDGSRLTLYSKQPFAQL
jgi:hypothetical protein